MHTLETKLPDGRAVRIFHNSDWSGLAALGWETPEGGWRTVDVPGDVMRYAMYAAAHRDITRRLMEALEQCDGRPGAAEVK